MKTTFTVSKCTANQKGGFVTTLTSEEIVRTFFGDKKLKQTYHVSAPDEQKVGTQLVIDPTEWAIQDYPFVNAEGNKISCLWLHLKPGVIPTVSVVEVKEVV